MVWRLVVTSLLRGHGQVSVRDVVDDGCRPISGSGVAGRHTGTASPRARAASQANPPHLRRCRSGHRGDPSLARRKMSSWTAMANCRVKVGSGMVSSSIELYGYPRWYPAYARGGRLATRSRDVRRGLTRGGLWPRVRVRLRHSRSSAVRAGYSGSGCYHG
jgi:hypothetical protein